jgi:cephalosporin hydroxylase
MRLSSRRWPRHDARAITRYSRVYYARASETWFATTWRGAGVLKTPNDMWMYQEIIHEVKPDLIIETGTFAGGSALFFADMLSLGGNGSVISIDIEKRDVPEHPRIEYMIGSSVSATVLESVTARAKGRQTLVVLDSDHSRDHVLAEMRCYAPLVSSGSYMIVEDTVIRDRRILPDHGPGPADAVDIFLAEDDRFDVDRSRERLLHTFNAGGYLRRK